MKKIISISCTLLLLTISSAIFTQNLLTELPTTKEEFVESEEQVLATINWLETTPFDEQEDKREKQKALLLAWLTNSPTVTLELNADVLTFTKKNPDLIIIFMGGWTKYSLENNYSSDNIQGSLAGLKSVIKVYKNLSLKKDKEVENLIELDNNGELENWVKEIMGKK